MVGKPGFWKAGRVSSWAVYLETGRERRVGPGPRKEPGLKRGSNERLKE